MIHIIIQQTSQETIAAKRTAAYRAQKRQTKEGVDELRAKARAYSKKYRMKKKGLDAQTTATPKAKRPAMTGAEKAAAYRARKRMTIEGREELRARSRASSRKWRMKNKMKAEVKIETTKSKGTVVLQKKAMTGAERQAAYRARKRATLQGTIELREKGKAYNRRYRMNQKVNSLILKELYRNLLVPSDPNLVVPPQVELPGIVDVIPPQVELPGIVDVDDDVTSKALMNEELHDFDSPKLGPKESFSDFPVPNVTLDKDVLRGKSIDNINMTTGV